MSRVNQSKTENAIEALLAAALKSENNKSTKKREPKSIFKISSKDKAALNRFNDDFINSLMAKSRKQKSEIFPNNRKTSNVATEQFKDAILIAALVRELSSDAFPLGRKRYQKISYLVLRKAEYDVTQKFLKKAAGPYDHNMRYKGGESIAIKNGYIKLVKKGGLAGFMPADNISAIDRYLPRYNFASSIDWVVQHFHYVKNDELELLTTVDYACLELTSSGIRITANRVRNLIANEPDWAPKLKRKVFSMINIQQALDKLKNYFPGDD